MVAYMKESYGQDGAKVTLAMLSDNKEEWPQTADQEIQIQLNEADAALVQAAHWGCGISILDEFQDLIIKPQQS